MLVLTPEVARAVFLNVSVASITSRIRGLAVEVPVGSANGLDEASIVNCDNIQTIPVGSLGRQIGGQLFDHEPLLTEAIMAAYDLD